MALGQPTFDPDTDTYTLSTGKTFYANKGIIGISPSGCVTEGYDGPIDDDFTVVERQELAMYMMNRWFNWFPVTEEEYLP